MSPHASTHDSAGHLSPPQSTAAVVDHPLPNDEEEAVLASATAPRVRLNTGQDRPDESRDIHASTSAGHSSRGRRGSISESRSRVAPSQLKADFEHSILSCLLFNVLYMYYCDARVLVLIIRSSQIVRLLYFAHETPNAQRSSAMLLFLSNVPVFLIHVAILAEGKVGAPLMINFIGTEPNALVKLFYIDCVTILLQAILASAASGDGIVVSTMPFAVVTAPTPAAASSTSDTLEGDVAAETTGVDHAASMRDASLTTSRHTSSMSSGAPRIADGTALPPNIRPDASESEDDTNSDNAPLLTSSERQSTTN